MPVPIYCPGCHATYNVADEHLGKLGRCKKCGKAFPLVPETRYEGDTPIGSTEVFPPPTPPDAKLPESFERYKVVRLLGRGGMGSVYLARDPKLNRLVALKVPHPHVLDRPEPRERFFREAQVAARFHHPNICPIYDFGEVDGVPFLTMAFIDGKTVAESIQTAKDWPPRRAAEVVRELALAIGTAHREGIIHRDLKPANIMIDNDGRIVLMDFGLARWYDAVDSSLTRTGEYPGTLAYMSPEQVNGDSTVIGPRTDIYSLGVILYELLTGRRPFEGPMLKVIGMIAMGEPDPPSKLREGIDPKLEAICLKSMARNQEDRHTSMDDFATALTGFLAEKSRGDESLVTNSLGMKLKLIPAGEFFMGSADGEPEALDNEKPWHKVQITRAFYLGVHEVTQAEYTVVVGTNPSHFSTEGQGQPKVEGIDTLKLPVEQVSWLDAIAFCNRLSEREGLTPCYSPSGKLLANGTGYRLPTEAEWEYACRGGTTTAFAPGAALSATEANFDGNFTYNGSEPGPALERTTEVGRYPANAFGLFDMHGNVWEWCHDWYDPEYYVKSPAIDPENKTQAARKVRRGGGWSSLPRLCRSAYRGRSTPDCRNFSLGFRVARIGPDL